MTDSNKKLLAIRDLLESAEKSIHTAKKLLAGMNDEQSWVDLSYLENAALSTYSNQEWRVIEGVFTWDAMLWADGNSYPIPHNYASKSKLVQGSKLKAVIAADGKITYKIIEEIAFETKIWLVALNRDKFQVVSGVKSYHVLMAAITFLKAQVGDTVSFRIPAGKDATYAALESIIPKN
jgi:hypothetical protein